MTIAVNERWPDAGCAIWLAACFPALGFEIAATPPGRPAVLAEDGRVLHTNAEARQAGIEAGASLAAARSLAAELVCRRRDAEAERQRLRQLGLAAYRYSSRVSLAWPTTPRASRQRRRAMPPPNLPPAVLLEARGSLRLFGSGGEATALATLLRRLARRLRRLGHHAQLAAAATPLAALALARAGLEGLPGDAATALRQVPLMCLDISAQQLERLANMGLVRLGQVLTLPTPELGSRLQPPLVDYLHRLTGRKADPQPCIEPPEQFRSTVHLLAAARDLDALLLPMRRLAAELAHWLAVRRLGAEALIWELRPPAGPSTSLTVRFAMPTADSAAFLALSRLRLEGVSGSAAFGEVAAMVLCAARTSAMPQPPAASLLAQPTNAGTPGPRPAARLALVDMLAARLGGDAVHALATADDHRPEHAWARAPAAGAMPTPAVSAPAVSSRPLWLCPTPQPVSARQAATFDFLAGPERIETGWWDAAEPRLCRDYFVVATPAHAHCWVFRNGGSLRNGANGQPGRRPAQWHLHGYFG